MGIYKFGDLKTCMTFSTYLDLKSLSFVTSKRLLVENGVERVSDVVFPIPGDRRYPNEIFQTLL